MLLKCNKIKLLICLKSLFKLITEFSISDYCLQRKNSIYEKVDTVFILNYFKVYLLISGSVNIESSTLSNSYSLTIVLLSSFVLTNNPVSFSIYVSAPVKVSEFDDKNPFMI